MILALVMVSLAVLKVRAHGIGTPQLLNEPAGPYLLSVWTDPDPLRADETHVVVAVIEPETNEMIVGEVDVQISMTSLADPSLVHIVTAGTDNVNRLLYAAEFNDLVTEGRWRVGVIATGERGASDEVTFEVDVVPARGFNWLWIGAGGLAVILIIWAAGSMRGDNQPRRTRRSSADI